MKCYRCRRKGIDSTMIKNNGYARCPVCGRETTYLTKSQKRRIREYENNSGGCLKTLLFIVLGVLCILGLIAANPWLLLVLLIPAIVLAIKYAKEDDDE